MYIMRAWRSLLLLVAVLCVNSICRVSAEEVADAGGAATTTKSDTDLGNVDDPVVAPAANVDDGFEDEAEKPAAKVFTLTNTNFEHDTQAASGATTGDWFIKFYAPWCGHCKRLAPAWDDLAQELAGEVNVAKVDVTMRGGSHLQKRFDIKGFPTLLFFRHGKMYKYKGRRSIDEMAKFARGGYKRTDEDNVRDVPPESQSMFTMENLKTTLNGLRTDIGKLSQGNTNIQRSSLALLVGILVIGVVMFAMIGSLMSVMSEPKKAPSAGRSGGGGGRGGGDGAAAKKDD